MIIFKTVSDIQLHLQGISNKTTGFVPTMGALHKGHLSLIERSRRENDVTVSSIFINPSQFNNAEDFRLYPVTVEKDVEALVLAGCDILLLPSVREIYPGDYQAKQYDLGALENKLEGKYRPGHFQGVCQVVDRLLDIISPSKLYLGRKDYQQCMVITRLTELRTKTSPSIVISDTVREDDGLAMSSRNTRLNPEQRKTATAIYDTLIFIKENQTSIPPGELQQKAADKLTAAGFEVDYCEVADAKTLEPATPSSSRKVALIAATLGGVRLIDNMLLE